MEGPSLRFDKPGLRFENPGLRFEKPGLRFEKPGLRFEKPELRFEKRRLRFEKQSGRRCVEPPPLDFGARKSAFINNRGFFQRNRRYREIPHQPTNYITLCETRFARGGCRRPGNDPPPSRLTIKTVTIHAPRATTLNFLLGQSAPPPRGFAPPPALQGWRRRENIKNLQEPKMVPFSIVDNHFTV